MHCSTALVPQWRLLPPFLHTVLSPTSPLPQADVQAIATIATLQSLTLSGEVYSTYGGEEEAGAGGSEDSEELRSSSPTVDLSWLGALHRLRKLDLQGLGPSEESVQHRLHLGGSASGGDGSTSSGCSQSRSPPPCLEALLLPKTTELDGPSVHALAGLRHLTRLSAGLAALNSVGCRAFAGRPPPPLAVTLQHIELWLWDSGTPASSLPVVAGLLAAKPPAALRLALEMDEYTTAQHLLVLLEVAERVREVAWLRISAGVDELQVDAGLGVGCRAHACACSGRPGRQHCARACTTACGG